MSDTFTFSGEARKVARDLSDGTVAIEVGVWTDGIGVFSDTDEQVVYRLEPGKKYRVTIEEIGRES